MKRAFILALFTILITSTRQITEYENFILHNTITEKGALLDLTMIVNGILRKLHCYSSKIHYDYVNELNKVLNLNGSNLIEINKLFDVGTQYISVATKIFEKSPLNFKLIYNSNCKKTFLSDALNFLPDEIIFQSNKTHSKSTIDLQIAYFIGKEIGRRIFNKYDYQGGNYSS